MTISLHSSGPVFLPAVLLAWRVAASSIPDAGAAGAPPLIEQSILWIIPTSFCSSSWFSP